MAESTDISWADKTWSPWYGCTQVSMGPQGACEGCYARHMSETRFHRVVFGGPGRGEGTRDVRADSAWKEPLAWERKEAALWAAWDLHCDQRQTQWPVLPTSEPKPSFVFPSMCDPFDNHPALAEPRRRFFDLIRATPHLTWLLLTKRPGNILKLWRETLMAGGPDGSKEHLEFFWPRNAAIGCTVVTQEEADRDVPKLLAAKAVLNPAFAFLSMEPLLGPVDLTRLRVAHPAYHGVQAHLDALIGQLFDLGDTPIADPAEATERLDWIITGGETDQGKHKARPADPAWFRSLRDQCAAAGVPFHFKQNGEWCEYGEHGQLADGTMNFLGKPDNAPNGWAKFGEGDSCRIVTRVGKERAGRLLDGRTHDARPVA